MRIVWIIIPKRKSNGVGMLVNIGVIDSAEKTTREIDNEINGSFFIIVCP